MRRALSPADIDAVKALFLEYAAFLGADICFQRFDHEVATFPDVYVSLWLAHVDGAPAAAVGMKDLGDGDMEMKRLFVRDAYRGVGLARALCHALIDEARRCGGRRVVLDTLSRLEPALALYADIGFRPIAPYNDNRVADVQHFALAL